MSGAAHVVIRPLAPDLIQEVVRIHVEGLGYTVNSRLGKAHLAFLYQKMAADPTCYAGVAMVEGQPVGIVSGTLNEKRLKSSLIKSMRALRLAGLAIGLVLRPTLLVGWLQSMVVALPVFHEGKEIAAVLTALAVASDCQRRGVGKELVLALEVFFAENNVGSYRLDTLISNHRAIKFYTDLGFRQAARRAGSVILLRTIGQ